MEAEAREERERILAEARTEGERILADARGEVETSRARRLDLERRQARAQRARLENDARLAGLRVLADAREALVDAALAQAEAELSVLRVKASYPDVLRRLLAEAASMVDARPLVVEVDPRDLELLRTVAAAEGLDVEALPTLHSAGGLVARDQAAAVLVHNTLEARLRKARGALRLEMTTAVQSEPRDTLPLGRF